MNLNWDQLRDVTEASALFLVEMLEQGEDMSSLGGGNSRNTPDILGEVGMAWSSAVEARSEKMNGEYIEALDRYIHNLAEYHHKKKRLFHVPYTDLFGLALSSIDEVIEEWAHDFDRRARS